MIRLNAAITSNRFSVFRLFDMPKRDRAVSGHFEKKPKAPRPSASFLQRPELTSLRQTEITAYFSAAPNQLQDLHPVQQVTINPLGAQFPASSSGGR